MTEKVIDHEAEFKHVAHSVFSNVDDDNDMLLLYSNGIYCTVSLDPNAHASFYPIDCLRYSADEFSAFMSKVGVTEGFSFNLKLDRFPFLYEVNSVNGLNFVAFALMMLNLFANNFDDSFLKLNFTFGPNAFLNPDNLTLSDCADLSFENFYYSGKLACSFDPAFVKVVESVDRVENNKVLANLLSKCANSEVDFSGIDLKHLNLRRFFNNNEVVEGFDFVFNGSNLTSLERKIDDGRTVSIGVTERYKKIAESFGVNVMDFLVVAYNFSIFRIYLGTKNVILSDVIDNMRKYSTYEKISSHIENAKEVLAEHGKPILLYNDRDFVFTKLIESGFVELALELDDSIKEMDYDDAHSFIDRFSEKSFFAEFVSACELISVNDFVRLQGIVE